MAPGHLRIPVDPFTEMMFCRDTEAYPYTDFTQLQFRGPVDENALTEAWDEALGQVPLFTSRLRIQRRGPIELPVWEVSGERNPLRFDDCRARASEPFDPMAFSMDHHQARLRRRIDLEREFPFQGHWLRIFDQRWILSIIYQHSVVDPYKAYRVITDLLAGYHQRVTGQPPAWAKAVGMASLKGRGQPLWEAPWQTVLTFPRELIQNLKAMTGWSRADGRVRVAPIATRRVSDPRLVPGRIGLRKVFADPKLPLALLARAKGQRASLNDLLLAVGQGVIEDWNAERGARRDWLRFMLVTSLKGRTEVAEHVGTGLSGLTYTARGGQGLSLDERIAFFRDHRRRMLAEHFDVKAYAWASAWYKPFRLVPFSLRRNKLGKLFGGGPLTWHLSNVGVMWPRIVDGKPTLDSVVTGAGDLEIEDVHSCPTFGPDCSMGTVVRMHAKKLYLNFVFNRFQFEPEEAQAFVDAFAAGLESAV